MPPEMAFDINQEDAKTMQSYEIGNCTKTWLFLFKKSQ
jgi:hypothetical protein